MRTDRRFLAVLGLLTLIQVLVYYDHFDRANEVFRLLNPKLFRRSPVIPFERRVQRGRFFTGGVHDHFTF